MEKQSESDDRTVFLSKDHLGGMFHKKGIIDGGLVGHNFIGTFLVNGEFLDEFKDKACLFGLRGTDSELIVHDLTISESAKISFFQHFAADMLQRGWQHLGFHHPECRVELFDQFRVEYALRISELDGQ